VHIANTCSLRLYFRSDRLLRKWFCIITISKAQTKTHTFRSPQGITDVGQIKDGQTVVVSGAAGSVGLVSVVSPQIRDATSH
jgi:hypothetical protein